MEAASNLTATCSSTALGQDVAAAAFRLSPLALRRIDFASLGVEPAAERVRRRCLRSQAWKRVGCRRAGRGPSGGVSAKRRKKEFGFRRNPLRTANSWKTFAWIWLSSALLRCSRALAERPAAWTAFRDRQCLRREESRRAQFRPIRARRSTSGDGTGFNKQFLDSLSRRLSVYRLAEVYCSLASLKPCCSHHNHILCSGC